MKKTMMIICFLFIPLVSSAAEPQKTQEEEPPKADSVWGAMRYTGYHIEKGSVIAGHAIKNGSITAGHEIKDGSVKAGKTMEKGFKKAGSSIKTFFVGDDD